MIVFQPPFPWGWSPAAATTGSPTVVNRGLPDRGEVNFVLQSHPTQASSASNLNGIGVGAGVSPAGRSRLDVRCSFSMSLLFFTSGVFAAALASTTAAIYVEEFTGPGGDYVGAMTSGATVLLREHPYYVSGSDEFVGQQPNRILGARFPAVAGHDYRVWFDVAGEMEAAGFGVGGSGARVQTFVRLRQLDVLFV